MKKIPLLLLFLLSSPTGVSGLLAGWGGKRICFCFCVIFASAVGCSHAQTSAPLPHWHPPQQLTFYWQLQGPPHVEPVMVSDFDGFDNTAATVQHFHSLGQHAVCYIDAGTWEEWRPDAGQFPASVRGASNGWPGEVWLDIRQLAILKPILAARFQLCSDKGFDAVEPDNLDGYENKSGFALTAADQLAFNAWLAEKVHALGMAIFLKNDSGQAAQLEPYYDGVISEQCNQFKECDGFRRFLAAGKPVLNIEYNAALFPAFCTKDRNAHIMGALFNKMLNGKVYKPCW